MNQWTVTVHVATPAPLTEDQLISLDEAAQKEDGSVFARGLDGPGFTFRGTVPSESLEDATGGVLYTAGSLARDHNGIIVGVIAETAELAEKHALAPSTPELMAATDVAELLGVSRQRVWQLQERPDFPEPYVRLGSGPVWTRPAIESFAENWQRKPGRPAKLQALP